MRLNASEFFTAKNAIVTVIDFAEVRCLVKNWITMLLVHSS